MGDAASKMGLTEKSGSSVGGFKENLLDGLMTFRTHRTVNVRNKYLAALYWSITSLAFIYILYSIFDGYQSNRNRGRLRRSRSYVYRSGCFTDVLQRTLY